MDNFDDFIPLIVVIIGAINAIFFSNKKKADEKRAMAETVKRKAAADNYEEDEEEIYIPKNVATSNKSSNDVNVFGHIYKGESTKRELKTGLSSSKQSPQRGRINACTDNIESKGRGRKDSKNINNDNSENTSMQTLRDSLHKKENLKQAVIMTEILNRKY
ncbi:MAG: hypothetical protein Q4F97_08010 [Bacteroidales bacterium]|nr:hypothetical protein [Bacteroidales bacterium]